MDYDDMVEDMVFSWLIMLPEEEIREITYQQKIDACLNEEAEEEIKDEMWRQLKNNFNYKSILQRLKNHLDSVVVETQESDEEAECVEEDSDSD